MKTLSANTTTAVDRPKVAPILLVRIYFTSPSALTLYLCSRAFSPRCTYDGHTYDRLIVGWTQIRCGEIDPITYATDPGDCALDILNDIPCGGKTRFSEIIADYDWAFAVVEISLIHEGAVTAGDEVLIFKGRIEQPETMSRTMVRIRVSDIALAYAAKWPCVMVETTTYPDADPDDVGRMLPQVWGQCKRVPFRAVNAGWKTTLAEDLAAAATGAKKFTEVTGLPASGTIQIDDEQLTYSSKSDANKTITISARGANSTDDVAHDLGATTAEIQTEYIYIIGHAVKAIDNVYVDGVRVTSGFTAYTGQTGDEHASYTGKACIKFTTLPVLKKQVNIEADDTIDVSDTIDVDTGSHDHGMTEEIVNWMFDLAEVDTAPVSYAYAVVDKDFYTGAFLEDDGAMIAVSKATYEGYQGTPTHIRLCMRTGNLPGTPDMIFAFADYNITVDAANSTVKGSWVALGTGWDTWAELNAGIGLIEKNGVGTSGDAVCEVWAEIKYTPDVTANAATGVAKTGAATKTGTVVLTGNSVADTVIGGEVSADVDGYQDDGSGTITGTPAALIEQPDHVFAHWILVMMGLSAGEMDSTDYTAAGTAYNADSYTLAVCLLAPPDPHRLFMEASRQAQSMQYWEAGVHHLIPLIDAGSFTADLDVSGLRIDLNQLVVEYTLRAYIRNTLTARYDHWWSGKEEVEADRKIVISSAAASVAKYGTLTSDEAFYFITGATMAQAILDWIKGDLDDPRIIVTFTGDPSFTAIERGDVLTFDTTETALDDALLDLVAGADKFIVLTKDYLPDFKQQLRMVKL